jgi:hypothetical protein|tara:strand:- start:315 stop:584 length:270 start_codon:yes stop_codon:yes gene_type:complete
MDFILKSYHSDKIAFLFEIISFVFTVVASFMLATTADNPQMEYIYPLFFIGSVTGAYAYYRRSLAFPMFLVAYFSVMNIYGFGVSLGAW